MGEGAALFVLKRLADAERDGDRDLRRAARRRRRRATARARASPRRTRSASGWPSSAPGATPGCRPATAHADRGPRHLDRASATSSSSAASPRCSAAPAPRRARSRWARSSRTSATSRPRPAPPACSRRSLALHDKVLPPSLHFERPEPERRLGRHRRSRSTPSCATGPAAPTAPARAGVSAFGFGGTNFHAVLEEYVPGRLPRNGKRPFASPVPGARAPLPTRRRRAASAAPPAKAPLRGALVLGGRDDADLADAAARLRSPRPRRARAPPPRRPGRRALARAASASRSTTPTPPTSRPRPSKALQALRRGNPAAWKALRAAGHLPRQRRAAARSRSSTPARARSTSTCCADAARARADRRRDVRRGRPGHDAAARGRPLTDIIFVDADRPGRRGAAPKQQLTQTEITQPAVLTTDLALTRLLARVRRRARHGHGPQPRRVRRAGRRRRAAVRRALEAVSARGREMASLSMRDNGAMAAVFGAAGRDRADRRRRSTATSSREHQQHQPGRSAAPPRRSSGPSRRSRRAGINAIPLPVSHAFHTSIVAPASEPLRRRCSGSTCARRRCRSSPT